MFLAFVPETHLCLCGLQVVIHSHTNIHCHTQGQIQDNIDIPTFTVTNRAKFFVTFQYSLPIIQFKWHYIKYFWAFTLHILLLISHVSSIGYDCSQIFLVHWLGKALSLYCIISFCCFLYDHCLYFLDIQGKLLALYNWCTTVIVHHLRLQLPILSHCIMQILISFKSYYSIFDFS